MKQKKVFNISTKKMDHSPLKFSHYFIIKNCVDLVSLVKLRGGKNFAQGGKLCSRGGNPRVPPPSVCITAEPLSFIAKNEYKIKFQCFFNIFQTFSTIIVF